MQKILLIAYKFPPYAGVGGYRWAQLCKYLARLDVEIHVVTINWTQNGQNSLLLAVQHPNIHIHKIPSGYPHNLALHDFGHRLLNGIRNKLFIYLIDKFFPIDMAQHWDRHLLPFCRELIATHNIKTVIATGHPFMDNVHAARLKLDLPNIFLIQDMRDLWLDDTRSISVASAQYTIISNYEKFALQNADAIVAVTEGFSRSFSKRSGDTPIYVIPNGYDPEKFKPVSRCRKVCKNLHFVHLGNIASGREICAENFLDWLRGNQHTATFAGSFPKNLLKKYTDLINSNQLKYVGTVSQESCLQLLSEADWALQFNAAHMQAAASTKIYEYAAAGIPILSFGYGGEAADFIEKARCGLAVDLRKTNWKSLFCQEDLTTTPNNFNWEYIHQFSYKNIANQYLNIFSRNTTNTMIQTINTP